MLFWNAGASVNFVMLIVVVMEVAAVGRRRSKHVVRRGINIVVEVVEKCKGVRIELVHELERDKKEEKI